MPDSAAAMVWICSQEKCRSATGGLLWNFGGSFPSATQNRTEQNTEYRSDVRLDRIFLLIGHSVDAGCPPVTIFKKSYNTGHVAASIQLARLPPRLGRERGLHCEASQLPTGGGWSPSHGRLCVESPIMWRIARLAWLARGALLRRLGRVSRLLRRSPTPRRGGVDYAFPIRNLAALGRAWGGENHGCPANRSETVKYGQCLRILEI